jgi:ribose transport system ATP-binding protein
METPNEILVMKNISKKYPGVQALNNVSFSLYAGEIHAIVGANGAGKSTLVGILSGARSKDEGSIFINGKEVNLNNPLSAIEMGIGYVPQELILCEKLSVAENISLNRQPRFTQSLPVIDKNQMYLDAEKIMSQLGIDIDVKTPLGNYQASTQQMVMLATALLRNAKIMILDEPTSSLTKKEIQSLFTVIKRLRDTGHALVYISHRLEEVFEIADRCTVLRDGQSLGTFDIEDVNRELLVNLITGKMITNEVNTRILGPNTKIKLSMQHLTVPGKLNDISLLYKRARF